jgi:hypothetical protein
VDEVTKEEKKITNSRQEKIDTFWTAWDDISYKMKYVNFSPSK